MNSSRKFRVLCSDRNDGPSIADKSAAAAMFPKLPRSVLPIRDAPSAGTVWYDAKVTDVDFPPIEPLRPPANAANVLVILLDDVGFGASSTFGGPVRTPITERLAQGEDLGVVPDDAELTARHPEIQCCEPG